MASNLWFLYALMASFSWGIAYVISEKLLRMGMTPALMMTISATVCAPLYLLLAAKFNEIKPGWELIKNNTDQLWIILLMAVTVVAGNFFSLLSISEKNATLTAFIEICYPLFTFILAALILKESQLNWSTACGGLLILAGIAVIYWKS